MDVDGFIKGFAEGQYQRSLKVLAAALDTAEFEAQQASDNSATQRRRDFLKTLSDHLTEMREQLRMELGEVDRG